MLIVGIIETHLSGSGEEDIGEGRKLFSSGGIKRREGVDLVLNSFTQKALL